MNLLFAQTDNTQTYYNIQEAKQRCGTHYSNSQEVYFSDFSWGYSLQSMENKFEEIYESGKRIGYHSQYNEQEQSFYVFLKRSQVHPVKIDENFIFNVTRQIERAIENGYAEFPFFPDMGHTHLYFPIDHWNNVYEPMDSSPSVQYLRYEKMLSDKKMHPLYHLSEQLQVLNENADPINELLAFRYWNRNYLGTNDGSSQFSIHQAPPENSYNTVRNIDGNSRWGAGFIISASHLGCFPYKDKNGQRRYFDISLHDPGVDPNAPASDF